MAINKVIRKGTTVLDLTSDTVTPETLMQGVTAHNAAGDPIVGTASSGIDTSDATATAADMLSGETAYAKGEKITGTFTIDSELTTQDNLISQIQTALQNKAAGSEPVLQNKTVTPSTSTQEVRPDTGYDGLSQVTVNAMTTATQATPSITVSTSGLITASATQTEGYVTGGTKSATKQLTTQAAKTITPSTSSQTAVAKNVYTTGAVTVAAIPSTYVKPTTTKSATTYTPSTSNQTIAAGTYCSGTQTIKGDSNLVAGNIKSGVSIFGVAGSYEGSGGGSGGSVETCECIFDCAAPAMETATVHYIDGNMTLTSKDFSIMDGTRIEVAKNTIITVVPWTSMTQMSGSCSQLCASWVGGSFIISGYSTIVYA